ncbi:MAG: M48 family metalloprotease [Planctomycetes bacterium]|nr:M48 family metalloprotease [Planctomycetota bacterium]
MKHLPQLALLFTFTMGLCACTLTYRLNESVDGLQAAMIADNLESSEDYYAGRGVSAVIVDEHPMADLDDEKVAERVVYMNELAGYLNAVSRGTTRSAAKLGASVTRTSEQQEHVDGIVLFRGVRVGLLADDEVACFATPGGFIWITQGALNLCRGEDELAALIAIQLGHAILDHPLTNYRVEFGGLIADPEGKRAEWFHNYSVGSNFGRLSITLGEGIMDRYYNTPYNLEADHYAALVLPQAGYEPRALVSLLNTLSIARQVQPGVGDWLERQNDLDARVVSTARFIGDHEMQVAASWYDKAAERQTSFDLTMGR